jgi:capsular polysaccharide transport system permease protein
VHGIIRPKAQSGDARQHDGVFALLRGIVWENRVFFLIVVLPTLIAAAYLELIAADQYESSADFIVRRSDSVASSSSVGQMLGFSIGAGATGPDAVLVQEYLLSHDAVARLAAKDDLVGVFRRPEADLLSRLWYAHPAPERLLAFYLRHVDVEGDEASGIMHLTVHSFRPEDSYRIAHQLLDMGEQQINAINDRTYKDNVASSQRELDKTRQQLAEIQSKLTTYRRSNQDVDPESTGRAQLTLVTGLTSSLVDAKARLQAMEGVISRNSPQYKALTGQVRALEAQIAGQSTKIAGPDHSVANRLSDYEQLVIQRDEVAKVYADAAVRLQAAQADAQRKQLYLIRVVQPNMPVKAEFPKRWQLIASIFAGLFFAYAIAWLLWAGVKEHSM